MALLEVEGWDHRQVTPTKPGWLNDATFNFVAGRTGGFGVRSFSGVGSPLTYTLPAPITGGAAVIVGVSSLWVSAFEGGPPNLLSFREGVTTHVGIRINNTTGQIEAVRGTTVVATSAITVPLNAWTHVEAKVSVADAGGTIVVRLNGSPTPVINFTGDTRNGGTAGQVDNILLRISSSNTSHTLDDFYVLDTTGPAPLNDFIGDHKIETLVPNGAGAFTQLAPTGAAANWQAVDENPPSATDYVGTAVAGQRDTYQHTDLATPSGVVRAVQPIAFAHKSDAGAAAVKFLIRSAGGTEQLGAAQQLSVTPNTFHAGEIRTLDPDGAALTVGSVNSMQFGIESA